MRARVAGIALSGTASPEALEEGATVAAAAAGSHPAFERLYRRHVGRVYGLCLRLTGHRETAEDCVQETFINAWRGLRRFQARSAFSTWLHRVAVNAVMKRYRGLGAALEVVVPEPVQEELRHAVADDPPLDLEAAIAALPPGARHVLVLVGLYGFTHEEAAELLEIAVGTSKAQLHRARVLLAARLNLPPEIA